MSMFWILLLIGLSLYFFGIVATAGLLFILWVVWGLLVASDFD